MKKIIFLFIILILLLSSFVSAHQPRIACSKDAEKGISVKNPEISKAYYSELNGKPHFYTIDSKNNFPIYAGILVPGKNLTYTVSFEISNESSVIYSGDGSNFTWWLFYEDYGKDHYMAGPEFGSQFKSIQNFSAGIYTIKVFNDNNKGKYSLAIGDVEKFSLVEIMRAVVNTIRLKLFFFSR